MPWAAVNFRPVPACSLTVACRSDSCAACLLHPTLHGAACGFKVRQPDPCLHDVDIWHGAGLACGFVRGFFRWIVASLPSRIRPVVHTAGGLNGIPVDGVKACAVGGCPVRAAQEYTTDCPEGLRACSRGPAGLQPRRRCQRTPRLRPCWRHPPKRHTAHQGRTRGLPP